MTGSYDYHIIAAYAWCAILPVAVLLFCGVYLFKVYQNTKKTIYETSCSDESDIMYDYAKNLNFREMCGFFKVLLAVISKSKRRMWNVVYPICLVSIVILPITVTVMLVMVLVGHNIESSKYWGVFIAFMLGSIGSLIVIGVYMVGSPLISIQTLITCREKSERDIASATFSITQRQLLQGNAALSAIAISIFTLVDFLVLIMAQKLIGSAQNPWGSALYVLSAAMGAHLCSLMFTSVCTSFSEGISISLFKLEAETLHRVDDTLRVAANSMQSTAGIQLVICGTILDLHGLSLAYLSSRGTSDFKVESQWIQFITPVISMASLLSLPFFLLIVKNSLDAAVVVMKSRISLFVSSMLGAAFSVAATVSLNTGKLHMPLFHGMSETKPSGIMYLCLFIGAFLIFIISIGVESFTRIFSRFSAEYCDISPTATKNSMLSFSNIFGFVVILLYVLVSNSISWGFGLDGQLFFLCGTAYTIAPIVLTYANCRTTISTSLCLSKTCSTTVEVQEILESLFWRCEILESYSHMMAAFTGPVISFHLATYFISFFNATDSHTPTSTLSTTIPLIGVGFSLLSEGIVKFLISRTTWRVSAEVEYLASRGDIYRSTSVVYSDSEDDPLKGDALLAVTTAGMFFVLGLSVIVLYIFVGMMMQAALYAGLVYIFLECVRGSISTALGASVRNFVVRGGLRCRESHFSTLHRAAVSAAADTAPWAYCSIIIGFTIWRLLMVFVLVMVPMMQKFDAVILY
eukprot:Tbor_TRINITY_DN9963_c0_g1::TRINITY_DN9963_c0_g1_i1::g.17666::m.17666